MGLLRLRASGYVRRDVLSAVGNAVWGTGKGHGGKGRLARPLQRGANETMRRDELIVGGGGWQREGRGAERSPLLESEGKERHP